MTDEQRDDVYIVKYTRHKVFTTSERHTGEEMTRTELIELLHAGMVTVLTAELKPKAKGI